jgi:hypothetical protein
MAGQGQGLSAGAAGIGRVSEDLYRSALLGQ